MEDLKQGEKGAWISIIAYMFLSIIKLAIGFIGNSEALRADGLNNTTDVIASIAVLIGLKISRKPPDIDHHYGHFRTESISSLIAAFIMISVGIQILINAIQSLFNATQLKPDMLTGWTALFSAIFMLFVYRYNKNLAKKIHSSSLRAAAEDNKSDALVSFGAFIGIIGTRFGFTWLDTLAALVVGVIICKTAYDIFKEASLTLTDGFDKEKLESIKATILNTSGVESIDDIRARTHGNKVFVDVTVLVKPSLNVFESHQITEEIEKKTLVEHKNTYVHVHIEPLYPL